MESRPREGEFVSHHRAPQNYGRALGRCRGVENALVPSQLFAAMWVFICMSHLECQVLKGSVGRDVAAMTP